MALIGYVRTYKKHEAEDAQVDALLRIGCSKIISDHTEAKDLQGSILPRLIDDLSDGDTLVVVRLDRLSRSRAEQLRLIDEIITKGIGFSSLRDMLDTNSFTGRRRLNELRLKSGAIAAPSPHSPSLPARSRNDSESSSRPFGPTAQARPTPYTSKRTLHKKYLEALAAREDEWLPHIKRLRPDTSWDDVVLTVNAARPKSGNWSKLRLQRAARTYVGYGFLSENVLAKPARFEIDRRLPKLISEIKENYPDITVAGICRELEVRGEPIPRGLERWSPTTVAALLNRAHRTKRNSF